MRGAAQAGGSSAATQELGNINSYRRVAAVVLGPFLPATAEALEFFAAGVKQSRRSLKEQALLLKKASYKPDPAVEAFAEALEEEQSRHRERERLFEKIASELNPRVEEEEVMAS